MDYEDNFCELSLLLEQPVHFIARDARHNIINEWDMQLPTVREVYFDTQFKNFISLLSAPMDNIRKQFTFITNLDNHFQLLTVLMKFNLNVTVYYVADMLHSFQILGIPALLQDGNLFINGEQITYALFNRIVEIIMVAAGVKKISDINLDPSMRAMQEKIDRIKQQGKKTTKEDVISEGNIKDMWMTLTYEFGYTIDEILHMNMYLINTILSYVSRSINYKVSLIAAGNGLTKKVKYITKK